MTDKFLIKDIESFYIIYASDVVTADGVDVFLDDMPDSPDNCVSILEFSGFTDFTSDVSNRSIQVMVRNTDYETARKDIWTLFDLVYKPEDDIRIVYFTVTRWGIVKARNTPYLLHRDESGRSIFMFIMGIVTHRDE